METVHKQIHPCIHILCKPSAAHCMPSFSHVNVPVDDLGLYAAVKMVQIKLGGGHEILVIINRIISSCLRLYLDTQT